MPGTDFLIVGSPGKLGWPRGRTGATVRGCWGQLVENKDSSGQWVESERSSVYSTPSGLAGPQQPPCLVVGGDLPGILPISKLANKAPSLRSYWSPLPCPPRTSSLSLLEGRPVLLGSWELIRGAQSPGSVSWSQGKS